MFYIFVQFPENPPDDVDPGRLTASIVFLSAHMKGGQLGGWGVGAGRMSAKQIKIGAGMQKMPLCDRDQP